MPADDPMDLVRFRTAQDAHDTYVEALAELRRGRKSTHWMWFVFPQIAGLGSSPTAVHFAIRSLDEARAYVADEVLGPRLVAAAQAALDAPAASAEALLGGVDAVKLRSSMTLFARAAPDEPVFRGVLDRWFGGEEDDATLRRI
jgi:uncharacterized protein (DUF1810 family)